MNMEMYLRFSAIATPMLALFVVGLILYVSSLRKRLERKAKHDANAKFNKERPFANTKERVHRGDSNKQGTPKPDAKPETTEKVTVTHTTYTGDEIPPEVRDAFKELHGAQDSLFKSVGKVFDALGQAGKGKQ